MCLRERDRLSHLAFRRCRSVLSSHCFIDQRKRVMHLCDLYFLPDVFQVCDVCCPFYFSLIVDIYCFVDSGFCSALLVRFSCIWIFFSYVICFLLRHY